MANKDNRTKFGRNNLLNPKEKQKVTYNKTTLPNGIRVITEEVPGIESFALGISINAGSRDDYENLQGISHFVEHAAFRRTKKRTSKQIAAQFESLGAYTNAYTTKEFTCFYVRALKPHFKKTLELLTDVTINPVFHDKDVEKERGIILEEIKSYEDDPEELIFDYGDELIFGYHGLGHPILGNPDSVKRITLKDLYNFHKEFYSPSNIIITSASSIPHEDIVKDVWGFFKDFEGNSFVSKRTPPVELSPRKITMSKAFQQNHILFSRAVPGMDSNEKYELAALNIMLGDGMSSRLYQHLRERHGLAYSIYSSLQLMSDSGALNIYAGTERKTQKRIERMVFEEFDKLIYQNIFKTEMNRTKEQLKSSTIMALESMSTRMQSLAKSEFTLGEYEEINETIRLIDSLTVKSVKETAARYLKKEDWNIVVFEPEEE